MDINETYFSAEGQEQLKNDLIQYYTKKDALITYACLSSLAKAAAAACKEVSDDAINFALDPKNDCQPLAGQGKHFQHLGLTFGIQFTNDYNYNQGDANGIEWQSTVNEINKLETSKKALTQKKKGLEAVILSDHPRLQPTQTAIVLKYIPSKS